MPLNNINKKLLSETDIITKFIMPAIKDAGWGDMFQIHHGLSWLSAFDNAKRR
jgi:type I site-specific restriction endonuclease